MDFLILAAVATTTMPTTFVLTLVALSLAYICGIILVQRKVLTNPLKMAEIQIKISEISKEVKQHLKNGDREAAMKKQGEIAGHMKESMKAQWKSMLFLAPLSLIISYFVLPTVFASTSTEVFNFIVPLSASAVFFWTAMIGSLVLTMFLTKRDRERVRARMAAQDPTAAQPQDASKPIASK